MSTFRVYMKSFFRWDVILFITSILVFLIWPELDLIIADAFYDRNSGEFLGDKPYILHLAYKIFAYIHFPLLLSLIFYSIYYHHRNRMSLKKRSLFLLCTLLLGPGLLVNIVLKDNSIGRARPEQTVLYGGSSEFTSPFEYSGECRKNCSFTSGHASIGFALIAVAWAARRRYYFIAGCVLGGLLGLMRMSQGAHFASDVLFSFWGVYFVSLCAAKYFRLNISRTEFRDTLVSPQ